MGKIKTTIKSPFNSTQAAPQEQPRNPNKIFKAAKMSLRSLRACMICSIVQPQAKFSREGCPNCEEFLELRHNGDAIAEATSSVFEGLITLADPENSWVAKWQRLQGYAPGTYAVKVVGVLPEEVIAAAENAGIKYIPRDGSGEVEQ